MKRTVLIAILSMLSVSAYAETFKCQSGNYWSEKGTIVVTATINQDGQTGTIKVAGVTHQAAYRVAGLNRRWDWGVNDDSYIYAFVIKPDHSAYYLDFSLADESGYVKASQFFKCRAVG